IAALHADSWRRTYRGILRDDFLGSEVFHDRKAVWEQKFEAPPANQWVLLALEADQLAGFICVYGGKDARWGSFIDNLHVAYAWKGQGIGANLMQAAAAWLRKNHPEAGMYLWVYEANVAARRFYKKMGAARVEFAQRKNPGGGVARSFRYAWTLEKMFAL
ncbi:MAG: GNAT family N-acetyltransferase, partial [Saprospiraceae bacterium]